MAHDFIGLANSKRVAEALNALRLSPETVARLAASMQDYVEEVAWTAERGRLVVKHHARTGGISRQLRGASAAGIVGIAAGRTN